MTHYVYRLYDATGDLLYVGCSADPFKRFKGHRAENRHWIEDVVRGRISVFPTSTLAHEAEREAIRTEHPFWNVAGRWTHHMEWHPEHYVRWVQMLRQHPYGHDANKQRIAQARIAFRTRFGSALPASFSRGRRVA